MTDSTVSLPRTIRSTARLVSCVMFASIFLFLGSSPRNDVLVQVIDAGSSAPIENAVVVVAGKAVVTDKNGVVSMPRAQPELSVRAVGHGRAKLALPGNAAGTIVVRLPKQTPKALYLSFYGAGDRTLRQSALALLGESELNALVIDVKDDRGHLAFRGGVALGAEVGAQKVIPVRDMAGFIAFLHSQGIYAVARLVVFKDNMLARAHPEWAVHTQSGGIWLDRDHMAWADPFRQEVWNYNIDIAEEAARLGFDEIQFDYLRFPDAPGVVFAKPSTDKSRVAAITGILSAAAKRLEPYNVFMSVDVFGYVLWNRDDTGIGQRLEDIAGHVDYLSPMLYPSSFQFGIPGYRNPVAHPYETVRQSLQNAKKRTGLPAEHFRPWLQAFDDYAYDRRRFGATQIGSQIRAAEEFGSNGWMLWNPRNVYVSDGLRKKGYRSAKN